ncbi:POU domain, class 4, transcription factor 2-like [Schistocerca americana]|uniref:POU domain, class 4, transcription factor 2-like n=1 Tax=Schistocerca americana TaxID=7009 RepID=UPI001F4F61F2|nr:POU domain, class 4, transcription factor 2-like [Schistocerca americana]
MRGAAGAGSAVAEIFGRCPVRGGRRDAEGEKPTAVMVRGWGGGGGGGGRMEPAVSGAFTAHPRLLGCYSSTTSDASSATTSPKCLQQHHEYRPVEHMQQHRQHHQTYIPSATSPLPPTGVSATTSSPGISAAELSASSLGVSSVAPTPPVGVPAAARSTLECHQLHHQHHHHQQNHLHHEMEYLQQHHPTSSHVPGIPNIIMWSTSSSTVNMRTKIITPII